MGRRPVQPAAQEGFPDKLESIGLVSKVGHSQTPTPGLLLKIQLPETLLSLFLPCNNSRQAGRKGWGAGRIKSCLLPPHQGFPEQLCLYGQDIWSRHTVKTLREGGPCAQSSLLPPSRNVCLRGQESKAPPLRGPVHPTIGAPTLLAGLGPRSRAERSGASSSQCP